MISRRMSGVFQFFAEWLPPRNLSLLDRDREDNMILLVGYGHMR